MSVRKSDPLPRFDLPEAIGVAMSEEEMSQTIQDAVTQTATMLHASKLLILTYLAEGDRLIGAALHGIPSSDFRSFNLPIVDFPLAKKALMTACIQVNSTSETPLPIPLRSLFEGEIFALPVMARERKLALILGQSEANTSPRDLEWQARACEVVDRVALVIELKRASSAYQDELRIRQTAHSIITDILDERPLNEIARRIIEIVSARLKAERMGLYLITDELLYEALALKNISQGYGESVSKVRAVGTYLNRALSMKLPYHVTGVQEDPDASPEMRELFKQEKITSLLFTPLLQGTVLKGVLVVYPDLGRVFSPAELAICRNFADQATLAISITQQMEMKSAAATIEERNRLAREIHDTVAQSLTVVSLQVETAETALLSGNVVLAKEMIAAARNQSKKALRETRGAIHDLAPDNLEKTTISEAIEEEARKFALETGVETPFILTGEERTLSQELRRALLRIAQEALNNARRHASANRVRVGLQFGAEKVSLLIEDDGVGFDPAAQSAPDTEGGYGLFGMHERARLLNGEAQIESVPGWGTRVRASLPYQTRREAEKTLNLFDPVEKPALSPPVERIAIPALPFSHAETLEGGHPRRIRVLIADDHEIVRKGVRDSLEAEGSVEIIGEARDGLEAFEEAKRLLPDAVLMDLQMPKADGLEGLKLIHAELPQIPVVILTTFQNESSIAEALRLGAKGYLLKNASPVEIADSLRAAVRGVLLLSQNVSESLAAFANQSGSKGLTTNINEREREVLHLIAQGARNKEIAAQLFITVSTVEKHISSLFHKLEATNRAELVRTAISRGLIFPGVNK